MENLQEKDTKEIIQLYSKAIKELKRRKVIRTNNVVGELGEYLAIRYIIIHRVCPILHQHQLEQRTLMQLVGKVTDSMHASFCAIVCFSKMYPNPFQEPSAIHSHHQTYIQ